MLLMANVLILELGAGYTVCTFLYVCDTAIKKLILTTHPNGHKA